MSFATKFVADKINAVFYVQSEERGINTYFYMAVRGNNIEHFRASIGKGVRELTRYGKILESGYGEPTYDVRQKMLELYGCSDEHALAIGQCA